MLYVRLELTTALEMDFCICTKYDTDTFIRVATVDFFLTSTVNANKCANAHWHLPNYHSSDFHAPCALKCAPSGGRARVF